MGLDQPDTSAAETSGSHKAQRQEVEQKAANGDHHAKPAISSNTERSTPKPGDDSEKPGANRNKESTHEDWEQIWAGVTAAATIVLTAATIALGWFTYKLWQETKTAVGDTASGLAHAEAAASAATKQAAISEKALISSNRPHIIIEPSFWEDLPSDETNSFFNFEFSIHNKGNSIAIIKQSWKNFVYITGVASEKLMEGLPIMEHYYFIESMAHRSDRITVDMPVTDIWAEVKSGVVFLYAYGGVSYESLSGRIHETRFCWRYDPLSKRFREARYNDTMNRRT